MLVRNELGWNWVWRAKSKTFEGKKLPQIYGDRRDKITKDWKYSKFIYLNLETERLIMLSAENCIDFFLNVQEKISSVWVYNYSKVKKKAMCYWLHIINNNKHSIIYNQCIINIIIVCVTIM